MLNVAVALMLAAPQLATSEGAQPSAPFIGVQVDVGVPDGAGASLVITTGRFVRLSVGGLSNGVGAGVRFGVTLMAFPSSLFRPLLGIDGGYVFAGQAAWLPQLIDDTRVRALISGLNVGFANAQVGFELGSKNVAFTLRAGLSYVAVGLGPQTFATGGGGTVTSSGLAIKGFIPSARLGFIFCFG